MDISRYKACTSFVVRCSAVNTQLTCHRGCIMGRKNSIPSKWRFILPHFSYELFSLLPLPSCSHVATLLPSPYFLQAPVLYKLLLSAICWLIYTSGILLWEYDMNVDKANSFISVKFFHFKVCFTLFVISCITSKEKHTWSSVVATKLLPRSKVGPSSFTVAEYTLPVLSLFWGCHSRVWRCLENVENFVSVFGQSLSKAPASTIAGFYSPFCSISTTCWHDGLPW